MKTGRAILCGQAVVVALVLIAAQLPRADADIIIFADGFSIEGKVRELTVPLFDPDSRNSLTIPKPGEPFRLDDGFRTIWFCPHQLIDAKPGPKGKKPDEVAFKLAPPRPQGDLPVGWSVESSSPWSSTWEREVVIAIPGGKKVKQKQRITEMTSDAIKVEGTSFKMIGYYSTKEFAADVLRTLIFDHPENRKAKDLEIRLKVYRFMLQAGMTDAAAKELDDMLREFPGEKSNIDSLVGNIRRIQAVQVAGIIQRLYQAGVYGEAEQKLALYAQHRLDDVLDERTQLQVQAVKDKLAAGKNKLTEAQRYLEAFAELTPPGQRALFQSAASTIIQELNADTVQRLETFLNLAADYERITKENRKAEQGPAEIMAFALTGWLRGSDAAERSPEIAIKQWEARNLLLAYLKNDDPLVRKNKLLPALAAKLGVDEAMQILPMLPPVDAHTNLESKPQTLHTQNDGKQFNYVVQLPPGYHHGRSWPVLIVLHYSLGKAAEAAAMWAPLAAQHGYIVAAPQWGTRADNLYQYTGTEHESVLETLRDLRRRFQVDSDRVFLFGLEQGANMAFDVGLAHPDQFTGVMPMSGSPVFFPRRNWSNAQNLHMYIVNGDASPTGVSETKLFFKEFIRCNYPGIHIEYKGRGIEVFGQELPILFDWMNRKRRFQPTKELGKAGQEFKTQRVSDNQFYWLSTSAIQPASLNSAAGWIGTDRSAKLRASVYTNNQISIVTSGVSQVSFWFPPKLLNYGDKVGVRINSAGPFWHKVTPNLETLLEVLYYTGDRQRLYFAKLDFKTQ